MLNWIAVTNSGERHADIVGCACYIAVQLPLYGKRETHDNQSLTHLLYTDFFRVFVKRAVELKVDKMERALFTPVLLLILIFFGLC